MKTLFRRPEVRRRIRSFLRDALKTLGAVLLAYLLAFLIILAVSEEPGTALRWFLLGPFSSVYEFGEIWKNAVPLMFAGVASCLILRGGQFNMFTEGAFYAGGLAGACIAIYSGLPGWLAATLGVLGGGLLSALIGWIPSRMKARHGVNEFVSSIMFNYIVLWVGVWLISQVIIDVSSGDNATRTIPSDARFPILFPGTNVNVGLLLAFATVILVEILLFRTRFGYQLRMTGDNPAFAGYSGIDVPKKVVLAQVAGIAVAGAGGAAEILGNYSRFNWKALPGYGFDGFLVAILAKNRPLAVPFAAFFLGYLRSGADLMAFNSDVAKEVVAIIQGLVILLVASERLFTWEGFRKWLRKRKGGEVHA